uniref:Leucine rich repeat neuronal 2 n=1 Tax=Cynoglossus semilaevis TaxID=244447 RepID=A0A3P8UWR8_CYNSE
MKPSSVFLRSHCFLCVFVGVCVPSVTGSLPHALPWHVSCPVRCVCQIKPWFSPDSVYHEAPTVECNNLLLTRLPVPLPSNTHTLRLQSNLLSKIDSKVLHRLPNLTDLDLSQNHFSHVKSVTESSLLPSLLSLHLEENHLSHLPDSSFSSLLALQELFLSHNNLHSIAPGAFTGLDSLLRLHINNNRLTTIDSQWFRALPRLEVLMLGGNPIEALPENSFSALKSLRSLVLGGMGLRGLAERALEGLDGLESLSFYNNQLTKVPTKALRRVSGLKFLDLNKNHIKMIETGDFRDMTHLKELGLNNMEQLVSVEKGALENLPELTKLEITNNPRLSYIHPQAFLQLNSLQEISLHSNPLQCDCLFHWAAKAASHSHKDKDKQTDKQLSRTVRFIQPQATLCSEPPELRSRKIRDVSAREMSATCLPMIPTGSLPSFVGIRAGGNLVLHCRGLAEPQPSMYWVTPSGLQLGPAPSHGSKGLVGPLSCHSLTDTAGFNHTTFSRQTQEDPRCIPFNHYRLLPEGTLEISQIAPSEAGLYTCIAENALGADTHSVTVVVHSREKKRKAMLYSNLKGTPLYSMDPRFEVREVGQYYAILSWQSARNLPSTRLSWQAIYSNAHTPVYTTRVLAGTQSFNLTHLQAETFYRVCLHLGNTEDAKRYSRRSKENRKSQCVSFKTKGRDSPINPGDGKFHRTVFQKIKRPEAVIMNLGTKDSSGLQPKQDEKLLSGEYC